MGKLNDMCGDVGDVEALTSCPQCKHGVEQCYCRRKRSRPSKTVASDYDMAQMKPKRIIAADSSYGPSEDLELFNHYRSSNAQNNTSEQKSKGVKHTRDADWCGELCRSTDMASSDCGLKGVSSKAVTCDLSMKQPPCPKEFTDPKNFCKGARGNWHEKAVDKGKTKYLWTNEVKNMRARVKKGEPTHVSLVSSKASKSIESDRDMGPMKPNSITHADSSNIIKRNPKYGPSKHSENLHPSRSGTQNNMSVQKDKELKFVPASVKEHGQMRQTSSAKDIKTSPAKNRKETGGTACASQMSRRSQTCDIPHGLPVRGGVGSSIPDLNAPPPDATLSHAIALTSSVKDIQTSPAKNQKEIGETACASRMSRRRQICDILHGLLGGGGAGSSIPDLNAPPPDATLSAAIALASTEVIKRTNGHLENAISKEPCADCQSPMSGVKPAKDAKSKDSDAGNVVFTVEEFYLKAAAEGPLPTDPAPDASWMGCFILKDEKTSISLQAYSTSQGLSKVKDFSKQMPKVLEFEVFSYKDFLMTVFKGCDPDEEDIGMYFFPDNMIRPNAYISLLGQLSGNLFLRSCIDGVELLVFTSKVLHKDYLNRNKPDFLWGVYRRRHGMCIAAVEETMAVDMDIDSDYFNRDVPPGFSPSMRGQWLASRKQDDVPPGSTAPVKIKEEVL